MRNNVPGSAFTVWWRAVADVGFLCDDVPFRLVVCWSFAS